MRCTVGDSQGTVDQGLGSARHLSPHRHTLGRVKDVIHALDITYHRPASICGSNVGDGHGLFRLRGECSIGLSQFRSHPDLQPYALSRRIRIIVPEETAARTVVRTRVAATARVWRRDAQLTQISHYARAISVLHIDNQTYQAVVVFRVPVVPDSLSHLLLYLSSLWLLLCFCSSSGRPGENA